MNARLFLFGDDLAPAAQRRRADADRAGADQRAEIEAADRAGYERGEAAGRAAAVAETARRQAEALERIGHGIAGAVAEVNRLAAAIEADALVFFEALARGLAGRAAAAQPLAAIADAAAEAFRHLRGIPHLAVRVHESLVEDADASLRAMARERGFEGRVIVIGSDELAPGDARLDWADGGIAAEQGAVDKAVAAILSATLDPAPDRNATG